MFEVPDYEEEKLTINIMDGMLDDKTISEDIICVVNIETDKILEWIDRHKWENHINYEGKEYKGKDTYPNVFIFEERNVLDKFVRSLRLSEHSMYGFITHDIIYVLSSSIDRIRIIKSYNPNDKTEDINGMCEFIDVQSFESRKVDDVLEERLIIKIDDIDYKYREIFYA